MNAFNFAIIVLLLGFAGFLAGTEASLNSISRIAVEELVNSKKRGSAWLLKGAYDEDRAVPFDRAGCAAARNRSGIGDPASQCAAHGMALCAQAHDERIGPCLGRQVQIL